MLGAPMTKLGNGLGVKISERIFAEIFQRDFKIFRQFAFDGHGFFGDGMRERQFIKVQRGAGKERTFFTAGFQAIILFEAREPERFSTVNFIANNGQIRVPQMDANLMRARGERFALQEGVAAAGEIFQHGETGFGVFTFLRVHAHESEF